MLRKLKMHHRRQNNIWYFVLPIMLLCSSCGIKTNTDIVDSLLSLKSRDSVYYYYSVINYFDTLDRGYDNINIDVRGKKFISIGDVKSGLEIKDKYNIPSSIINNWRDCSGQGVIHINFKKRNICFEQMDIRNEEYQYPYLLYFYENCYEFIESQKATEKIIYDKSKINNNYKSFIYFVDEHWLIVVPQSN